MTEVEVHDWEADQAVTLALDPAQAPVAQMEALYHKARRLDRVGDQVLVRLDTAESQLERLATALDTVADADARGLDAIEALLPPARRERRSGEKASDITTWTGPAGQRVATPRPTDGSRSRWRRGSTGGCTCASALAPTWSSRRRETAHPTYPCCWRRRR